MSEDILENNVQPFRNASVSVLDVPSWNLVHSGNMVAKTDSSAGAPQRFVASSLRWLLPLALALGASLLGMGCEQRNVDASKKNSPTDASTSTNIVFVTAVDQIPEKAKSHYVETARLPIKNPTLLNRLKDALSIDSEFSTLKDYLLREGFAFAPGDANYITATDNSDTPLIGFSYTTYDAASRASVFLVIFYRAADVANDLHAAPIYCYLREFKYSEGRSLLIWVDRGDLSGFLER